MKAMNFRTWSAKANAAKVAISHAGGGPYIGYHTGTDEVLHELGIVPDAYLPGCVGTWHAVYSISSRLEGLHPNHYSDLFMKHGGVPRRVYRHAPFSGAFGPDYG